MFVWVGSLGKGIDDELKTYSIERKTIVNYRIAHTVTITISDFVS